MKKIQISYYKKFLLFTIITMIALIAFDIQLIDTMYHMMFVIISAISITVLVRYDVTLIVEYLMNKGKSERWAVRFIKLLYDLSFLMTISFLGISILIEDIHQYDNLVTSIIRSCGHISTPMYISLLCEYFSRKAKLRKEESEGE